jgi:spore maturation protein CgeB
LAKYTKALLADDDLRSRMGRQAHEHVLANFQYKQLAKKALETMKERLGM